MAVELQGLPPLFYGFGVSRELGATVAKSARRVALVRGGSGERAETVRVSLAGAGVAVVEVAVLHEPEVGEVVAAAARLKAEPVEAVVACGGGSVLDFGKALAAFATLEGDPSDHLEVVGRGLPLTVPPLPWHAVPTTAGTGAEVTRNAVLAVPERRVKVSLRSPLLLARSVWLDPDLLKGLPLAVRAATGLDALTQLIEPYVCSRATLHSDVWCEAGIPRVARALPAWLAGDESPAVREAMAWGALWSGAALAQAGLGAVHGLAGPLGGYCRAPHGAVCGALLAPVMEANVAGLPEAHEGRLRYERIAAWLTQEGSARAEEGAAWVRDLVAKAGVPTLRHWGVSEQDLAPVARQALQASSMKANPVRLDEGALISVLRRAW